jgi:hypothetical protein
VVTRRHIVLAAAGALAIAGFATTVLDAQKPERKREVKLPGLDLSLKAGWKLLFHDGCRFAVPVSWRTDDNRRLAFGPDGSNFSLRKVYIPSWSAHKAKILAAFGNRDRVRVLHENDDRRLWFEIADPPRVQHFVDVNAGQSVCNGILEVRTASSLTTEDASRIVNSIGPAPP